jgi:crotonobetainyl-CoA:carnitine CoA-transferase CaiB-like acyl-CoA transferase
VRERSGGALPGISPSNTYPTADGAYVVIAGNSDPIFRRLMVAIGRPDLGQAPDLQSNEGRVARNDELDAAIAAWSLALPIADVLTRLDAAEVPAGRIYSVADIVTDPHYQARDMLLAETLPDGTAVKMPGIVPKLSATPGQVNWRGPVLGEHSAAVLGDLGYSAEEIEKLRAAGVTP